MKSNVRINKWVFWPPFTILMVSALLSLIDDKAFGTVVKSGFDWSVSNVGWLYSLTTLIVTLTCAVIYCTPAGSIKFGGKDAKPEFKYWNWFAMSLCAGIGIGIVFWGVAEPMYHISSPPESLGIKAFSADASIFAMSTCFLHWSFSPYSLYVICAIPIGLAVYNYNLPFTVSSALYFMFGKRPSNWVCNLVDSLCLFAIAAGVAASLGHGLMQLGSGVQEVFGIEPTKVVWAVLAVIVISTYTISSYTGLQKGIRILSDQNAKLFFAVMIFILVVGPTRSIFDMGTQALGEYIGTFFQKSLWMGAGSGDQWPRWWSIFYWAVWIIYAPIVGLFLARLVRGRTIREFLTVNLIAPAIFSIIWFAVFGGASIALQTAGTFDLAGAMKASGMESAVFTFFKQFPLGSILVPLFLIVIAISFITLADSMTSCIAAMSVTGLDGASSEAPGYLKITWGVIIGALAYFFISFAGINGPKMLSFLAALPIVFLIIAILISLIIYLYGNFPWSYNPSVNATTTLAEVQTREEKSQSVNPIMTEESV